MRGRNRHNFEAYGEVFFVTSTIVGFIKLFDINSIRDIIIENLTYYQNRGDYTILAYVIMPNHIHLVLKANKDHSISAIIGNIKRITSRKIRDELSRLNHWNILNELESHSKKETQIAKIWKPRFDCLVITNERTLVQKVEYIHNNPVKKGLVENPDEYFYSSASNYKGFENNILNVGFNWRCIGY